MAKVLLFKPYRHQCPPSVWKKKGLCPLCEEHRKKLDKHIRESRFRARARKGIVNE